MFNKICNLLKKIEENGYKAYVVGGFVRDFYMNKDNLDVDICSSATPEELKNIFPNIVEKQYGVSILNEDNVSYEITTFRKELKYINNRYPSKVKLIRNLKKDLQRRDFTMNSICMNYTGNYIDLFNGRKDIDNKIIKTIGNSNKKIKEDVLRILRAIRFSCLYDFELDEKLKKAIIKNGYLLSNLSYFRKKQELEKILLGPNPKKGIDLIISLNLEKYLELENLSKLVFTDSIIGIWAQLGAYDTYEFTMEEKKMMVNINKLLSENKDIDKNTLYNYGLEICLIVAQIKNLDKNKIINEYNNLPIKSYKDINISSDEIIKLVGTNKISAIYKQLEGLIINNKLKNDNKEIINYIVKPK